MVLFGRLSSARTTESSGSLVGAVGIESTSYMETKEFCGAAWPGLPESLTGLGPATELDAMLATQLPSGRYWKKNLQGCPRIKFLESVDSFTLDELGCWAKDRAKGNITYRTNFLASPLSRLIRIV
jgi:hypothetical protein